MGGPMDPKPDPGNSPPEDWTEPLTDEEQQEIADRLQRESSRESGDT